MVAFKFVIVSLLSALVATALPVPVPQLPGAAASSSSSTVAGGDDTDSYPGNNYYWKEKKRDGIAIPVAAAVDDTVTATVEADFQVDSVPVFYW